MPLVSPLLKVLCPYCFHRFHPSDAPARSIAPGPTEPDTALGDFLRIVPPEMRPVEPVPTEPVHLKWQRRFWLPRERSPDRKKICPRCHMFLPHRLSSGELASEVLAIVGGRNDGKSNYFGVSINALEARYAREVGFSMFAQDTFSLRKMQPVSSRELYQERYGSRLFSSQPKALNSTPSAVTNPENLIPLIYRMQFQQRAGSSPPRPRSSLNAIDLAIFDAAGEDLQDTVMRQQFAGYVAAASGILFLVDPFALPDMALLLPPTHRSALPQQGDCREVIQGAINLLERRDGQGARGKIAVPIAVVLTKTDMLEGIVDPSSPIVRDCRHADGFNEDDCLACSQEVEHYLQLWGCGDVVHLVRSHFADVQFFAVSSLGQSPGPGGRLAAVAPRRVADPLLWMFWRRGYLGRSIA